MRNPNGLGSVVKLAGKRRKPYAARVTTGWTKDGKQLKKYIGYYSSKADAMNALAQYSYNPLAMDVSKVTLLDVFNLWSEPKFRDASLQTIRGYNAAFARMEKLHNVTIQSIKTAQLQKCIDDCKLSYASKKKMLILFHQLFAYATINDIITKDYSQYVKVGVKEDKPVRPIFTADEIATLQRYAGSSLAVDIILVGIYSGLRPQELLNLKKGDIDTIENTLSVTKSKTDAGVRIVPISTKIQLIIRNRLKYSMKYLFEKDGNQIGYDYYLKSIFNPILGKLGLNPLHRPHDTRHTFATLLSNADANTAAIKKLCGHSNYATTIKHYTHKDLEELKKAVNLI